jgi:hypothetical protein
VLRLTCITTTTTRSHSPALHFLYRFLLLFLIFFLSSFQYLQTWAAMATMRTRNTLAPPPSPIPTAAGSRSAANQTFTEYLEHSLRPPNLALPATTRHPIPSNVDLRSLASRGRDSIDRILQSARHHGVFRISGHGISGEELRSLVEEAEPVLRNSDAPNLVKRNGNRKEILWARSRNERLESAPKFIGSETERYRNFR